MVVRFIDEMQMFTLTYNFDKQLDSNVIICVEGLYFSQCDAYNAGGVNYSPKVCVVPASCLLYRVIEPARRTQQHGEQMKIRVQWKHRYLQLQSNFK